MLEKESNVRCVSSRRKLTGVADTPRIALGASGPTMSTRQREQLAADQSEIVEASPYTRTGGTDFMSGNMSRVRDRQVLTEAMAAPPPRPKTPAEIVADEGLADYNRRQERKAREEQERLGKIARRRQQEVDEKAARERRAKLAQTQFLENAVMHECSDLSPAESQSFWERVTAIGAGLDPASASVVAEAIRLARKV